MTSIDWIIAVAPIFMVIGVGLYCKAQIRGVSDFTAARRSAGRYLLCIAGGELQAGAVVFISWYESISNSGFTLGWWNWLFAPIGIIITITGFISYRFRETRAMTLAQFFELRYNKSFRVFAGIIGFGAACSISASFPSWARPACLISSACRQRSISFHSMCRRPSCS